MRNAQVALIRCFSGVFFGPRSIVLQRVPTLTSRAPFISMGHCILKSANGSHVTFPDKAPTFGNTLVRANCSAHGFATNANMRRCKIPSGIPRRAWNKPACPRFLD